MKMAVFLKTIICYFIFSFDFEKGILSFITKHPTITQAAKYNITGKILVLPVYGNGESTNTFSKYLPALKNIIILPTFELLT